MRENDIEGWMSLPELEFLYETSKEMKTIVELGSYLGRSTVALAEGCQGTVYAVDHWKGSEGLKMDGTEESKFRKNIKDFNNIVVMKATTTEASNKLEADMVFIDADHTYKAIKNDIKTWLPKANVMICGHDYDEDGAKKAVDELIGIDGVIGSIWYKWL